MSNKVIDAEITKRELDEHVKLAISLDSASTKDLGDGVLEAIITTSAVDRHNESIDTAGISYKDYMNNPVVLYGHDYDGLPIGKTLKLTKQMGSQIKARFQLAVEEYPFAATVYEMIKGGYINAVSIGGIVKEWSKDYSTILKMDMAEFSIVPVPANSEALITSRSLEQATGKTIDTIKAEFQDFSRSILLDKVKGMDENELEDAIKVLKNLVVRLEQTSQDPKLIDATNIKTVRHFILKDAKAVQAQSQMVIKTIKLSIKDNNNERQQTGQGRK